jgi:hypothetical protein
MSIILRRSRCGGDATGAIDAAIGVGAVAVTGAGAVAAIGATVAAIGAGAGVVGAGAAGTGAAVIIGKVLAARATVKSNP